MAYIAAAAAAAPLCCCHLLLRGDLVLKGDSLDGGARTEVEAHLLHTHGCAVGRERLAATREERCTNRDARILMLMQERKERKEGSERACRRDGPVY